MQKKPLHDHPISSSIFLIQNLFYSTYLSFPEIILFIDIFIVLLLPLTPILYESVNTVSFHVLISLVFTLTW